MSSALTVLAQEEYGLVGPSVRFQPVFSRYPSITSGESASRAGPSRMSTFKTSFPGRYFLHHVYYRPYGQPLPGRDSYSDTRSVCQVTITSDGHPVGRPAHATLILIVVQPFSLRFSSGHFNHDEDARKTRVCRAQVIVVPDFELEGKIFTGNTDVR